MKARTHADRLKALHHAERTLERKLRALQRLTASIRLWQRRVKYYTAQIAMTDEQRQQTIQQKRERAEARRLARRPR